MRRVVWRFSGKVLACSWAGAKRTAWLRRWRSRRTESSCWTALVARSSCRGKSMRMSWNTDHRLVRICWQILTTYADGSATFGNSGRVCCGPDETALSAAKQVFRSMSFVHGEERESH